jgi:hypothetical protein
MAGHVVLSLGVSRIKCLKFEVPPSWRLLLWSNADLKLPAFPTLLDALFTI